MTPHYKSNVLETINNENGTALKFNDGTMICYINIFVSDQAINTPYQSVFIGSRTWNFPVPFIEAPAVSCSLFKWGSSASWGLVSSIDKSGTTLRGMDYVSRNEGTNTRISAIAIGRWKE